MNADVIHYLSNAGTREEILGFLLQHIYLSLLPVAFGALLSVPLGWAASRYRLLRGLLFGASNVIYTIPSLAMFVVIPLVIGTGVLDAANVVVALTVYTTALLVRPVADALDAVPDNVLMSATAMGYRLTHRFLTVELPLAVPVLAAGMRVASVSNISLVSVGALIGIGSLGTLFTRGFQLPYLAPIIVGIVLIVALAVVMDLVLVLLRRVLTPVGQGSGVVILQGFLDYLADPAHWQGPNGIPVRVLEHLRYTVIAVVLAAVIGIGLGLYVGHTGRGGVLVVGLSNWMRAVPTLGLVTFLFLIFKGGEGPTLAALVVLAVPPILAGTYAGVQDVDRGVVDAARGMGMSGWQLLWQAEVPNALPLLMGGLRNAVLQVVATTTVGAFVGLGGLGRYVLDGVRVLDYSQVLVGAVLMALLAVLLDALLAIAQRIIVPRGLRLATAAVAGRANRQTEKPGLAKASLDRKGTSE